MCRKPDPGAPQALNQHQQFLWTPRAVVAGGVAYEALAISTATNSNFSLNVEEELKQLRGLLNSQKPEGFLEQSGWLVAPQGKQRPACVTCCCWTRVTAVLHAATGWSTARFRLPSAWVTPCWGAAAGHHYPAPEPPPASHSAGSLLNQQRCECRKHFMSSS